MNIKSSIAVINTSPWISLSLCGRIGLLKDLYDKILIPPAVKEEITAGGKSQNIVSRVGLADVRAFGISWGDCEDFLSRLGYQVSIKVTEKQANV